jgi:hypothetical protein
MSLLVLITSISITITIITSIIMKHPSRPRLDSLNLGREHLPRRGRRSGVAARPLPLRMLLHLSLLFQELGFMLLEVMCMIPPADVKMMQLLMILYGTSLEKTE